MEVIEREPDGGTPSLTVETRRQRQSGARGKVAGEIFELLRQDIAGSRLKPGDRLPNERHMAEHFGVSQPTVREAVRALEAVGLVDVRHGSGVYVRGDSEHVVAKALQTLLQVNRVSIIEALDVREMLGRQTARIATVTATETELANLYRQVDALAVLRSETSTVESIVDALAAFQVAFSASAHNPLLYAIEGFLVNLLLQIQIKALRNRGVSYWIDRSASFHEDRKALLDAVQARDPDRAAVAMDQYLDHQRRMFLADPKLSEMRLSDAKAAQALGEIVVGTRVELR